MRFWLGCCPGLWSHLKARLGRAWTSAPNSLTALLAASLRGRLTTWQLASSGASDPRGSEKAPKMEATALS